MKKSLARNILWIASVLAAGCLQAENLIPNGDFETGLPENLFVREGVVVSLFEGSPIPGEKSKETGYCAEVLLDPTVAIGVGTNVKIPVDPALKYRISVKLFTEASVTMRAIGNAFDDADGVIPSATHVWTYWLHNEEGKQQEMGPTPGWITMKCTLGPAGSGADYEWDPKTSWINMSVQFGEGEGKAYLDARELVSVESFK